MEALGARHTAERLAVAHAQVSEIARKAGAGVEARAPVVGPALHADHIIAEGRPRRIAEGPVVAAARGHGMKPLITYAPALRGVPAAIRDQCDRGRGRQAWLALGR